MFGTVGVPTAYLPRFETRSGERNEDGVANVLLFTTSTCSLLDGSTKALRQHAQRTRHSLKTRKTQGSSTSSRTHANMIPLIPTLALAFVSFICSAFVILRILIPILPPHPLSRRVRPVSSHYPPTVPPDQLTALTLTVRIWSSQLQDSFPRRQKSHLACMLRYFGIGNLRMASRGRTPWWSRRVRGRF